MTELASNLITISLLTMMPRAALGCGVIPAGQENTRTFNVTGFKLPVPMAYSSAVDVQARFPGIATSEAGAKGFVDRLVMQTVFDVLERQARNSLLPDAVISSILSQLRVQTSYKPLNCEKALRPEQRLTENMKPNCIIVDNTVTGICTGRRNMKCDMPMRNVKIASVPVDHTSISGTLSTTNIIMANWSRTMWQNVVNRAVRMLALDPIGSHFFSASASVGGN